ncbi:MAG TPA: NAD-dependent protein deacylase [Saprospirales bacterium]|nr:NAD-dependent protein deacylase [Saprospirales bacterium]HAY70802.1 NAD-dependent protein deacylase [Saprospirales bacterium]HRQ29935.1 NAD-dependent deacylase [Saprospiraceae bacterium]
MFKQKIAVLTGAGMSQESGLQTFRDSDGLWEGHNVYDVATPDGWYSNKQLVLDFYNARRRQLVTAEPNEGHMGICELDKKYDTCIITQNVDDLHERAGSKNVIHLHGELFKVRSTVDEDLVYAWREDLKLGDLCEKGYQLRPHIVWFGENVPNLEIAAKEVMKADILLIIGTSLQVYPAASLVHYLAPGKPMYYIDPNPNISYEIARSYNLKIINQKASSGVSTLLKTLLD